MHPSKPKDKDVLPLPHSPPTPQLHYEVLTFLNLMLIHVLSFKILVSTKNQAACFLFSFFLKLIFIFKDRLALPTMVRSTTGMPMATHVSTLVTP